MVIRGGIKVMVILGGANMVVIRVGGEDGGLREVANMVVLGEWQRW